MSLAMQVIKQRKAATANWNRAYIAPRAPGMSYYNGGMMYSRARQGQAGGWLGDLVKGVARVATPLVSGIPLIGGLVAGIGQGAFDSAKRTKTAAPGGPSSGGLSLSSVPPSTVGPGMSGMPQIGPTNPFANPNSGNPYAPETPAPEPGSPGTVVATMGGTAVAHRPGSKDMAPVGYHWNKSGYWSDDNHLLPGAHWVAKGTKLVKDRQRNPFNPHAASRSMSRLASLSKGMKVLERHMAKLAPRKHSCRSTGKFGRKK